MATATYYSVAYHNVQDSHRVSIIGLTKTGNLHPGIIGFLRPGLAVVIVPVSSHPWVTHATCRAELKPEETGPLDRECTAVVAQISCVAPIPLLSLQKQRLGSTPPVLDVLLKIVDPSQPWNNKVGWGTPRTFPRRGTTNPLVRVIGAVYNMGQGAPQLVITIDENAQFDVATMDCWDWKAGQMSSSQELPNDDRDQLWVVLSHAISTGFVVQE